ncbi:MAG: type II toxin-antitoxin system Phd/YefM family antitoxin [Clostridiales bacterium]|nr:type II toxin-antitoxin system Phd/YefM family antitoxin [Clostridiales bacterium]
MLNIRPISDLRNNFADISKTVHESAQPVFLTKNGYGDMVVMSLEKYKAITSESIIAAKLKESALEAKSTPQRFDFLETAAEMREKLIEKI